MRSQTAAAGCRSIDEREICFYDARGRVSLALADATRADIDAAIKLSLYTHVDCIEDIRAAVAKLDFGLSKSVRRAGRPAEKSRDLRYQFATGSLFPKSRGP